MAAATRFFGQRGVGGTGIGHIAKAAGVAHGTFYVHFPNKEALLEELLGEFNSDFAEHLARSWEALPAGDHEALVRTAAELFLDYWEEHRDLVELYAQRAAPGLTLESLRDGVNPQAAALLTNRLRETARATLLDPTVVDLLATGLLALWFRVGMQVLFKEDVGREQGLATLVSATLGVIEDVLGASTV